MSYVAQLDAMSNDFKQYAKKHGIQKPDALTLVNFLREKNFTDVEIESTFAELGYPIDMSNLTTLDPNYEEQSDERAQAIKNIMSYIKQMNKPTFNVFMDIMRNYEQQRKQQKEVPKEVPIEQEQSKKKKPHVKLKTTQIENKIDSINKEYIFESYSSVLIENAVSKKNAEKILDIAASTGKLKISKNNLINIWKKSYSNSTDIQDLNRLISRAGIKPMPATRIAKQYNIPIAKENEIKYAERIAAIIIEYGLAEEILKEIKRKYKLNEHNTRQKQRIMSESEMRRVLAEILIKENKEYMQ